MVHDPEGLLRVGERLLRGIVAVPGVGRQCLSEGGRGAAAPRRVQGVLRLSEHAVARSPDRPASQDAVVWFWQRIQSLAPSASSRVIASVSTVIARPGLRMLDGP